MRSVEAVASNGDSLSTWVTESQQVSQRKVMDGDRHNYIDFCVDL